MNQSCGASVYSSEPSRNHVISIMDPTKDSIFTAGLDDVTTMSKILYELHHADDQSVLVIRSDGIRLITAGEKTFQVSAYFAKSIFQRFKFNTENYNQVNFRFMLRDFIESLNLLRDDPIVENDKVQVEDGQANDISTTSLYIQYRRKGDPLKLRLENKSNYVINCDLKAFNLPNDSMFYPLAFLEGEETAEIVLNSKKLFEYVSGLDLVSSDYVHLVMGRGEVPLKLSTRSTLLGEVELEITQNESDIIKQEIVVSDNCLFSFSYKTQFMKPALEALRTSAFMQMRCGSSGLLSIEHFHPVDKFNQRGEPSFSRSENSYNQSQNKRSSVEYFILSESKLITEASL